MTGGSRRLLWGLAVGAFTCAALWALWAGRFPPLQDYPEQLFYTQGLHVAGDPAFDYDRYYEFSLPPVYAAFYLATLTFAKLVPIEVAGKLALSLYPLFVALVVVQLGRRFQDRGTAPWGALLFFPLAFNQQYYFGNINYLLSLPLLVLALLDLEDLLRGELRAWPVVRQALWQVVLVVTHPLSFLVYLGLAVVGAVLLRRRTERFGGKFGTVLGIAAFLLVAFRLANGATPAWEGSSAASMHWLSFLLTLQFSALMFTGMQWSQGPEFLALAAWAGIAFIVLGGLWNEWRTRRSLSLPVTHQVYLLLAVLGVLALPFSVGTFSYVNMRLTAVVYFLAALLAAQVPFRGWRAACLVGLLAVCMVDSAAKQRRISAEIDEIVPIVERIPPRSRILPLVIDRDSPELESYWFDPHLHDHSYYHLIVGGGYNPYLLGSPLRPVQSKAGEKRPSPGEFFAHQFSWKTHAADYQYFLLRGAPQSAADFMAVRCNQVLASGKWLLFERRIE